MEEAKAVARYVRLSPWKARQVADLVRGKRVDEAIAMLAFTPKRASRVIEKVIRSARANAEHNYEMDGDSLYVAGIFVDEGPTWKRYQPRAMGRANVRRKRTSHITVVLREGKGG
ncbi:MAG: 50S ribosomal protein L22 [Clostridia bacterium]|nr:MAG: 50S ribosomal protein L22 [Clostridia bacterium]